MVQRKTLCLDRANNIFHSSDLHVRHKCQIKDGMNGKYIYIMKGKIVKLQLRPTLAPLVLLQVPKAYFGYLTLNLRYLGFTSGTWANIIGAHF
jgi:hypothetical protein